MVDVVGRHALDPEQMAVRERGLGASVHEPGTLGVAPAPCKEDQGAVASSPDVPRQASGPDAHRRYTLISASRVRILTCG